MSGRWGREGARAMAQALMQARRSEGNGAGIARAIGTSAIGARTVTAITGTTGTGRGTARAAGTTTTGGTGGCWFPRSRAAGSRTDRRPPLSVPPPAAADTTTSTMIANARAGQTGQTGTRSATATATVTARETGTVTAIAARATGTTSRGESASGPGRLRESEGRERGFCNETRPALRSANDA